jgi:hypothetical protein
VSRTEALPLSFAQQRLWFLHQLAPDNPFYNVPAAVRLSGDLNVVVLEQSLNAVVQRHEVLRTTFVPVEGQPRQATAPIVDFRLPILDLTTIPNPDSQLSNLILEEAQQPFDLTEDLLLRVKLLQLKKTEFVMVLTLHHIAADGWSMNVLIQELATLYSNFCNGNPSPLPELPIQYADFALWQRQWLQGEVLETQLAYWKQQLGNNLPVLELPTDHPRTAMQTFRGGKQSLVLSESLSAALRALSVREGVTLFMALVAAFQTLLHWYTNQEDIVVGTDVANRNRAETEGLIGFFVNQLVLRTDLAGDLTFREVLRRVREVMLGAYAHQDLPFDKLVEALNPERNLSRTPLFQVKIVQQAAASLPVDLAGLTLGPIEVEWGIATFDLLLNVTDTEAGIVGSLTYNSDLYEAGRMTRLLEYWESLLCQVVARPEVRLSELKGMLDTADRQYRLVQEQVYQEAMQQKLRGIKRRSSNRL